jgi:hypothetical protein
VKPDRFADPPPDPVAHHGFTNGTRNRETDTRPIGLRLPNGKSGKQGAGKLRSPVVDPSEIFGAQQADTFRKTSDGNYLSELTVSFLRPRARRRASTARPFFVSIRERKPCVLARWRLFGWKVRFGMVVQD